MHRKTATVPPPLHYRNRLPAQYPRPSNSPSTRCRTRACTRSTQASSTCAQGKDAQTWDIPEGFDHNDTFIAEVSNFINAIEKGSPPAIPLNEGIDVLNLCLQMRKQCILAA